MINDLAKYRASADFSKARGRAVLSQIQHFINKDHDRLLSFNDVKHILKPKNQVYRGLQVIPINLIVGSEGRYHDFNKFFLPKYDNLRTRWERVDEAHIRDLILPPIQLYEIGGVYFVRDGNHRVSVAKMQNVEFIDAEVTSLATEIKLEPSQTVGELEKSVIKNEKNIFYEKTCFGSITDDNNLDFTSVGQYDVIYNHILVHKYYLNLNKETEIPFHEALISWYNNVYRQVTKIIDDQELLANFPKRCMGDLYVWIVKHWDFLKEKYGAYSLEDAAGNFSQEYGNGHRKKIRRLTLLAKCAAKIFRIKE